MWMSWSRDALCAIIDAVKDVRRCEARIWDDDEERLQMRRPRAFERTALDERSWQWR
jgi:hypothetical protein